MTLSIVFLLALTTQSVVVYKTNLDGQVQYVGTTLSPVHNFNTPPQQMPGWPKSMGTHPNYKPSGVSLADLNNDGCLEIVAGSTDNKVYAWDYQGNLLPGWPLTLPAMVQAKVAIGDIDNNGDLEIVIPCRNGYVYIYNHDGTSFPNWPQNANGVLGLVAPTLFDLDRDGDLEIIMPQMQSGQPGHVYVWHHNGQIYPGWPQNTDYLAVATASVADIDNDGVFEICVLAYRSVYVWDQNGNLKPGWPKLNIASGSSYAQPVMADLDGDSDLEILHAYYLNSQDYVGIYNHNATNFPNWPQSFPGPQHYTTPVTGDIDGDSDYEIFGGGHVLGGPNLLARHHNGTPLNGWPVCDMLECSPVVCDIDDDGYREVLVADNLSPGNFNAYNYDASNVTDWPIVTTAAALVNSPSVGDVDADGDIEIALVLMDGSVNLWTIESIPYRGYLTDWGTFYHDLWNTGWLHPRPPRNLSAARFPNYVNLVWSKNSESDIAGYNIYRSITSGGPYRRINRSLITDTTYNDSTTSSYCYCVTAQIKAFAESRLSNEVIVGISEKSTQQFRPFSIYPNPFTHTIRFSVPADNMISAKIYDVAGKVIDKISGKRLFEWRPGKTIPDGIYFVEISAGNKSVIKKVIKFTDNR